ncbi:MAG TPA: energy transducer TonB [Terriglobales bacterium]|nr:energy transducer TonB [Terriglobales bacterium]
MHRIACLLVLLLPAAGLAATPSNGLLNSRTAFHAIYATLDSGRVNLLKFQPLEEADVAMECESTEPPQALATPHAWVAAIPDNTKIVVNFIIGTDGQVYSPFVLDGPGSDSLYRKLVNEVRHWHYRPALCNGVPTDAEVKVQLSSR